MTARIGAEDFAKEKPKGEPKEMTGYVGAMPDDEFPNQMMSVMLIGMAAMFLGLIYRTVVPR